jgi:deazaflavin-dependent oxidoreductase (nitroreductase family)
MDILAAFVAINTLMYVCLAILKLLPRFRLPNVMRRPYSRAESRSIHPHAAPDANEPDAGIPRSMPGKHAAWLNAAVTEFPEARWGSDKTVVARAARTFAGTKVGSWTIRNLMPLDRKILVRTQGRFTLLGPIGLPALLLETTGRKSGTKRFSPLLFARDGNSLIVVGSNFGQAHHPAWTGNLIAHPHGAVKMGGKDIPVNAELLEGAEADAAYQKMDQAAGVYSIYKTRTDRNIRVFRLTPA